MHVYDIYYKRNGEFLGRYKAVSPQSATEQCLSKYNVQLLYSEDISAAIRLYFAVIMRKNNHRRIW
jgi:hypothetical protein